MSVFCVRNSFSVCGGWSNNELTNNNNNYRKSSDCGVFRDLQEPNYVRTNYSTSWEVKKHHFQSLHDASHVIAGQWEDGKSK